MADFAAVIRRAVDGLSDNTPEMRVKVYEKARGAVQRQLESMKPRPPEEMLRRQLDKLETAIVEVENEHAEALPAAEDAFEPVYEEAVHDAAAHEQPGGDGFVEHEPEAQAPAYASDTAEQAEPFPAHQPDPVAPVVEAAEVSEPETVSEPEPWDAPVDTVAEPEADAVAPPVQELIIGADVIRQAIAGIPNSTPGIRAQVYDQARQAVRGHLESHGAGVPDDIRQRQYDKLELAIAEVERDYDQPPAVVAAQAVDVVETYVAEPVRAPVHSDDERDPWDPPVEVAAAEQSSQGLVPDERQIGLWQEPVPETDTSDIDAPPGESDRAAAEDGRETPRAEAWDGAPAADDFLTPAVETAHGVQAYPDNDYQSVDAAGPFVDTVDVSEPPVDVPTPAEDNDDDWLRGAMPVRVETDHRAAADDDHDRPSETDTSHEQPVETAGRERLDEPEWVREHRDDEPAATMVAGEPWVFPEPAVDDRRTGNRSPDGFDDPVDDTTAVAGQQPDADPKMPAALDLLAWDDSQFDEPAPGRKIDQSASSDPFGDSVFSDGAAVTAAAVASPPQNSWSDLDDLIDRKKPGSRDLSEPRDVPPPDLATVVAQRQTKSFRAEPKRRINYLAILLGLFLVAALGGSGYAAWMYRDKLTDVVDGLMASGPQLPGTDTKPVDTAEKPVTEPTTDAKPTNTAETPANPTSSDTSKDLASLETTPALSKFTQRLKTDGTESDEGPAIAAGDALPVEGKSVAEQNVASSTDTPVSTTTTPTTEQPAVVDTTPTATDLTTTTPTTTTTTTTAQQTAIPAGAGQKLFLYEERLGQSVPTAIEGTVTWSVLQETGENGKAEPVVQGQVNVPDRGLSGLITFKRNNDPSLPASHLVEIVFSLPQGFEGGSIDSVQRIAMKQTEQDRGNALVAVPVKITDDFHMIALNDLPEARASNIDLLRTRNWIDMPITYRNGRRALLTMDKGPTGVEAFNTAIREWAALDASPATGQ